MTACFFPAAYSSPHAVRSSHRLVMNHSPPTAANTRWGQGSQFSRDGLVYIHLLVKTGRVLARHLSFFVGNAHFVVPVLTRHFRCSCISMTGYYLATPVFFTPKSDGLLRFDQAFVVVLRGLHVVFFSPHKCALPCTKHARNLGVDVYVRCSFPRSRSSSSSSSLALHRKTSCWCSDAVRARASWRALYSTA